MRRRRSFLSLLRAVSRSTTGGLTTVAALSLPVVIGAAGLAFDLNRGYQQRIVNQRAADMGALGAAIAFTNNGNASILTPTAQDIARANGLSGANVVAELLTDFPSAGSQSVRVTVTQPLPFSLAAVLGLSGNFDVAASSLASLTSPVTYAAPCFLALDGGAAALTVTGGASINAPDCSIAAIGEIENKGTAITGADIISGGAGIMVNHGSLSANTLRFATGFSKPQWNNSVPPPEDRINEPTTLVDPWEGDPELVSAYTRLGTYRTPPTIVAPPVATGTDFNFKSSGASSSVSPYQQSDRNRFVLPTGNYEIRSLSTGGGLDIVFGDGSNITVSRDVSIGGGTSVNFGNSNVYVAGDFGSGSNGVRIGRGDLAIGGDALFEGTNTKGDGDVLIAGSATFKGGSTTIMGEGRHLFGSVASQGGGFKVRLGDGDFQSSAGVNLAGDSELALGDGDIVIGPGNANRAIMLAGSARFFMGDGAFSANGDIDTSGGTRLVFGRTGNHLINGDLEPKGSVLFGRGRYTVNGDFENGTGGTTWPYTSTLTGQTYGDVVEGVSGSGFDMLGVNVTFILSGTIKLAGGAKTKLYAPDYDVSGSLIADLLASSESDDDANWTGGSVNDFAGTIHFPRAQVKMAGGNATVSNRCMTLIARYIRVNGGAATGTACNRMEDAIGGGSGSTAAIRLLG